MSITIDVTSDFICPWCRIGQKRLFQAIDGLPKEIEVAVRWLPFELNPDMPAQGMDRKTYRSLKFGSWRRSQELDEGTIAAGAADGVLFDYANMLRTPNTFAAHRLSWLGAQEGRQRAIVDAILQGYFAEGRDIGDLGELADIAAGAGIDAEQAHAYLTSGGGEEVRQQEQASRARGIRGVPHFDIAGTVITGAQSSVILRGAILDAWAMKS
jgi:predicted DsbA family dithiol-disulfide isomerase